MKQRDGADALATVRKGMLRARNNRVGWECPFLIHRHWADHAKEIAAETLSGHGLPSGSAFVE